MMIKKLPILFLRGSPFAFRFGAGESRASGTSHEGNLLAGMGKSGGADEQGKTPAPNEFSQIAWFLINSLN